jgi:hypothetical protein
MPQNQEINDSRLLLEQLDRRDRGIDCIGLSGSEKAESTASGFPDRKKPI